MDKLLEILQEINPDIDFTKEEDLIGKRMIDSFSIVKLVARLSDEFDIEISPLDIVPENFNSAKAIYAMIQRLED